MLRTEFRDFPTGQIAVNPVEKGRISTHLRRKRIKEAGCFQKHIHALIDVAHKDHRRACGLFLFPTGKRP